MNPADVRRIVAASLALKQRFFEASGEQLLAIAERICAALRSGGKLLLFGNGGSAADAQHFAAELVGRFLDARRPALPVLALTTDSSILTAVGNDIGFEAVFRRQVEAHGRPGDVAFGITTSGRSPNVVEGLRAAGERGLVRIALTGNGGGRLVGAVDYLLDVPHTETARIQEVHGMVIHLLCQMIEEDLLQSPAR